MAAALARVVGGGAAARLSLAEMMGVRGARVAPEASAVAGVPGCMHGLRGRVDENPCLKFALAINYGEGDCHISRVEIRRSPRERCILSSFTTRTGACSTQRCA